MLYLVDSRVVSRVLSLSAAVAASPMSISHPREVSHGQLGEVRETTLHLSYPKYQPGPCSLKPCNLCGAQGIQWAFYLAAVCRVVAGRKVAELPKGPLAHVEAGRRRRRPTPKALFDCGETPVGA